MSDQIGVPFSTKIDRGAKERTTQKGKGFTAEYLVPFQASRVIFKDEDDNAGPVWVDGIAYAVVTYDDGMETEGWYPISTARKIAKAFGCKLEMV